MELKVTHNQFQDPLSPSNIITHKTGVCGSSPQWPTIFFRHSLHYPRRDSSFQHVPQATWLTSVWFFGD